MIDILLIAANPDVRSAIADAARTLGYQLYERIDPARDAVTQIADIQPSLIIVESDALPRWIAEVRANPATRRLPVLAVGVANAQTRDVHITDVLNLDDVRGTLPDALAERVHLFREHDALAASCADAPPSQVLKGLHEFNAHEYFECHETLEAAWLAEGGPVRDLYRVILQVGLAYYQIERGNYYGALKMFLRSVQWFGPLPDRCQGIDIAQLRADSIAARAHLEALGPDRIAAFDRALLKPLVYTLPSEAVWKGD